MVYTLEELALRVAPVAHKHKVHRIYIFGSYARGEAREDSDVDLLIDDEGPRVQDCSRSGALYRDLQKAMGKEPDLMPSYMLRRKPKHEIDRKLMENVRRDMTLLYSLSL